MRSISLFQPWVKNVYNLRIGTSTTGGSLYTISHTPIHQPLFTTDNSLLIPNFTPYSYTQLSPQIFHKLHLLYTRLYTLSTGPIIKKNKEKERNS